MGDVFTVADAYLFVVIRWAKLNGIDLARWPKLVAWAARVGARPAVRKVLEDEGFTREAKVA
jgi:glutathione S-transferase